MADPQPGDRYDDDDDLLRLAEVERKVSLSRSTIYKRIGEGTFPPPMQLGGGVVRWRKGAIRHWLQSLVQSSLGSKARQDKAA